MHKKEEFPCEKSDVLDVSTGLFSQKRREWIEWIVIMNEMFH